MLFGESESAGEKPVMVIYGISDLLRGGFTNLGLTIPNISWKNLLAWNLPNWKSQQVRHNQRVIVKSGVSASESSGDLINLCYLDAIFKFDSSNHLCQVFEPT